MKKSLLIILMTPAIMTFILWSCNKSDTPAEEDHAVTTTKDIYYVAGDTSHKHMLDVYYKQNSALSKVVFFVPGGAWRQGDKDQYDSMAVMLASRVCS